MANKKKRKYTLKKKKKNRNNNKSKKNRIRKLCLLDCDEFGPIYTFKISCCKKK